MKRISFVLTLALVLGTTLPTTAAESPVGRWNTIDEKTGQARSQVEIYEQGGKYFGKITSIPQPNDSQGNPKTCSKCTGADKDKPIVGLLILDPDLVQSHELVRMYTSGRTALRCSTSSWRKTTRRRGTTPVRRT
jgi:hypothetical protein